MSCEYCNNCKFANCHVIKSEIYNERKNWYCAHGKSKVLIDLTTEKDELITPPSWCPINTNKLKIDKTYTISEMREMIKSVKSITTWDDLKVNEIYHLPPLIDGDKRKDILITSKSQYSLSYKVLNEKTSHQINTYYPSSIEVKFLVPHKIMKFEIINGGVR